MLDSIDHFDSNFFIEKYWEEKPVVINGLIDDYKSINIDEVACLAMENEIVSRIIRFKNNSPENLEIDYGPFSEKKISQLNENDPWTLLIQDTEKYLESINNLIAAFNFLPNDFFDDAMASISGNNGTTGPHLDWYSVFILQIDGHKKWKVETTKRTYEDHLSNIHDDLELKILKSMNDYKEINLSPGQILYIPPGHGHWGLANKRSFSLSLGYQGPRLNYLIDEYIKLITKNIHEDTRVSFEKSSIINGKLQLSIENWPSEIKINNKESLLSLLQKAKDRDL